MVERGWWLLVWSVVAAGCVYMVCGGSVCQQGQQYYNSQLSRCVPCTRCHDPLVVVVPCYVYRDAECAPASQFLPAQPHIPVSIPAPAPALNHTKEISQDQTQLSKDSSSQQPSGHRKRKKAQLSKDASFSQNQSTGRRKEIKIKIKSNKSSHHSTSQESLECLEKNERHHRHRQWKSYHRTYNKTEELEEKIASQNGVLNVVKENADSVVIDGESFSESGESFSESYLQEPHSEVWPHNLLLSTIIIITVFILVVFILTLYHIRTLHTEKVCIVQGKEDTEKNALEQLLPSGSSPEVQPVNRRVVTYIRAARPNATTALSEQGPAHSASPHPISSHPIINPAIQPSQPVESEQINGQSYPLIPFTMDRLLEQRRFLGPASSLDTNLYVESWQQQDSLGAGHYLCPSPPPVSHTHRTFLREVVSAAPSPAPVRTYRPASASASPVMSTRSSGWPRGRVRGEGGLAVCALSSSTGGLVMRDSVSSRHM